MRAAGGACRHAPLRLFRPPCGRQRVGHAGRQHEEAPLRPWWGSCLEGGVRWRSPVWFGQSMDGTAARGCTPPGFCWRSLCPRRRRPTARPAPGCPLGCAQTGRRRCRPGRCRVPPGATLRTHAEVARVRCCEGGAGSSGGAQWERKLAGMTGLHMPPRPPPVPPPSPVTHPRITWPLG